MTKAAPGYVLLPLNYNKKYTTIDGFVVVRITAAQMAPTNGDGHGDCYEIRPVGSMHWQELLGCINVGHSWLLVFMGEAGGKIITNMPFEVLV